MFIFGLADPLMKNNFKVKVFSDFRPIYTKDNNYKDNDEDIVLKTLNSCSLYSWNHLRTIYS